MMERHLDAELDRVRQQILRMGGEAEAMLQRAMQALTDRRSGEAQRVRELDDRVDDLEMRIDNEIFLIMAKQQPTAVDLRFLMAATRIIHELERVADSAKNIAKSVLKLNEQPPLKPYIDLPRMSEIAAGMVRESLDAFTAEDAVKAREVIGRDEAIDGLYKQINRELLTYMMEDPKAVSRGLEIINVARNLERVADHAANIAEDVVFHVEAADIRHPRDDD